jgi:ribosome maturation factor RimP
MNSGSVHGIDTDLLEDIVSDVVTSSGFSLVEWTLGGTPKRSILRVYVYRSEGVALEDCERVSRELGSVLDEKDLFPGSYVLEVSSPGAERALRGKEEYEIFRGREAKLEVTDEDGRARTIIGRLGPLADDAITLEVGSSGEVTVPFVRIRKARLYIDWERVAKGKPDEF